MINSYDIHRFVVKCKIETDNYYSDLYIPKNSITERIIDRYEYKRNVETFKSQIDDSLWYDIPFCFIPMLKGVTND